MIYKLISLWMSARMKSVKWRRAMVVFKQNAIERESLKNELIKIADVDSLTGLFTRKFGNA